MQRTTTVNLVRDERLVKTIKTFSEVYSYVANIGYAEKTYNKVTLHRLTYKDVRKRWPELPSALVQTARDVASEALKRTHLKKRINPKEYSSVRLDKRNLKVHFESGEISISSTCGRLKIKFDPTNVRYNDWQPRSGTLSFKNGKLRLNVVVEKEAPDKIEGDVLGIDLGINNIAVCSNNQFFNSKHLRDAKGRYRHLRSCLQSKGTRSAKRHLAKLRGRERRFVKDVNHCLSKTLINSSYAIFALEDLKNMKKKSNGKRFNRKLGGWSFAELQKFIDYKSETLGKTTVLVNPAYTSQTCSRCNHTARSNRNGPSFHCPNCDLRLHADLNASRNIAVRGRTAYSRLSSTSQSLPDGSSKPRNSSLGS